MNSNFLNRKLSGCIIKGARYAREHKKKHGTFPEPFPVHCKYASASEKTGDPFCERKRKLIKNMDTCPLEVSQSTRPAKKRRTLPPLKGTGITWVFIKTRNTYHMLQRSRRAYCRDHFNVMRVFHVENMPISSICRHCIKAYRVERAEIDAKSGSYKPDSPLFRPERG